MHGCIEAHPASLQTGYVDMDKLEEKALEFRPRMIICGASAYPRDWDYRRFREIADKVAASHCSMNAQLSDQLLHVS